jgi:hypothetical protein
LKIVANMPVRNESAQGDWKEMEQRQRMLSPTRERGATHIAIIGANELVTGNLPGKSGRSWPACPRARCWLCRRSIYFTGRHRPDARLLSLGQRPHRDAVPRYSGIVLESRREGYQHHHRCTGRSIFPGAIP